MKILPLISFVFILCACTTGSREIDKLKLQKVAIPGDANVLLGTSYNQKYMVVANFYFAGDSLRSEVAAMTKDSMYVNKAGYTYGNFVSDSSMLMIDMNSRPWVFKINGGDVRNFQTDMDFRDKDFTDIAIGIWNGKVAVALKNDSCVLLQYIGDSTHQKFFGLGGFNRNYKSIESFDLLRNRMLLCLKATNLDRDGNDKYYIVIKDGEDLNLLDSVSCKTAKDCSPIVKFADSNNYLLSYCDSATVIRLRDLKGHKKERIFSINDRKVLNLSFYQDTMYLTGKLLKEAAVTRDTPPLRTLFEGLHVSKSSLINE